MATPRGARGGARLPFARPGGAALVRGGASSGPGPGRDPERGGPAVLADALETRSRPLADLVVDAELSQWDRWLGYETGRVSALHAVAAVVAGLRPDDIARQVARVADRLALDYDIVTPIVADAVSSAVDGHLKLPAGGHADPIDHHGA